MASDRAYPGTVPIYSYHDPTFDTTILTTVAGLGAPYTSQTLVFHAFSPTYSAGTADIVPLNQFINPTTFKQLFSTSDSVAEPGYVKQPSPVAKVWRYPLRVNPHKIAVDMPQAGVGEWMEHE